MKKLLSLISILSFLFLATSCGKAPFAPDRTKPAGMILVNGEIETDSDPEPGQMVYAEFADNQYRFPLDAAMVYYFDYDEETAYAGDQNCTSLTFTANADTKQVEVQAECRYIFREGSENAPSWYYLYYDGKGLGFYPMQKLWGLEVNTTGNVGGTIGQYQFTVECGRPAAFFTVSSRQGEKELSFETIRPDEMEDYMKYELPEGTDNVEINSFDANGEFIDRKVLEAGEYSYTASYDIGGQFMGAKTLRLVWPQLTEE